MFIIAYNQKKSKYQIWFFLQVISGLTLDFQDYESSSLPSEVHHDGNLHCPYSGYLQVWWTQFKKYILLFFNFATLIPNKLRHYVKCKSSKSIFYSQQTTENMIKCFKWKITALEFDGSRTSQKKLGQGE